MIEVGIITAPRTESTVSASIQSLREAGFEQHITLFAEPGEYDLGEAKHDMGLTYCFNYTQRGCFKNFHHALSTLAYRTAKPYITVLLDDMIYLKGLYPFMVQTLKRHQGDFGYYSMITINQDVVPIIRKDPTASGWQLSGQSWDCWGGLFIMQTHIARQLIEHEFYQSHMKYYVEHFRNQQIDACVSLCCKAMGLPMYMHLPSLAEHIGAASTIGHGKLVPARQAYQFNPDLDLSQYCL